jgi:hypothetical protein
MSASEFEIAHCDLIRLIVIVGLAQPNRCLIPTPKEQKEKDCSQQPAASKQSTTPNQKRTRNLSP